MGAFGGYIIGLGGFMLGLSLLYVSIHRTIDVPPELLVVAVVLITIGGAAIAYSQWFAL